MKHMIICFNCVLFQKPVYDFIHFIDIEGFGDKSEEYDYRLSFPLLAASDLIIMNRQGQQRTNDFLNDMQL